MESGPETSHEPQQHHDLSSSQEQMSSSSQPLQHPFPMQEASQPQQHYQQYQQRASQQYHNPPPMTDQQQAAQQHNPQSQSQEQQQYAQQAQQMYQEHLMQQQYHQQQQQIMQQQIQQLQTQEQRTSQQFQEPHHQQQQARQFQQQPQQQAQPSPAPKPRVEESPTDFSSSPLSNDPRWSASTVYSGYLTKLGSFIKSWKNRFFILTQQGNLYYFKDHCQKEPLGHLNVHGQIFFLKDRFNGKNHVLRVILDMGRTRRQKIFSFYCTSDETTRIWIEKLIQVGAVYHEEVDKETAQKEIMEQEARHQQSVEFLNEKKEEIDTFMHNIQESFPETGVIGTPVEQPHVQSLQTKQEPMMQSDYTPQQGGVSFEQLHNAVSRENMSQQPQEDSTPNEVATSEGYSVLAPSNEEQGGNTFENQDEYDDVSIGAEEEYQADAPQSHEVYEEAPESAVQEEESNMNDNNGPLFEEEEQVVLHQEEGEEQIVHEYDEDSQEQEVVEEIPQEMEEENQHEEQTEVEVANVEDVPQEADEDQQEMEAAVEDTPQENAQEVHDEIEQNESGEECQEPELVES